MSTHRPLILTIDRHDNVVYGPALKGRLYLSGIPTVTGMRPMNWWEHQIYRLKQLIYRWRQPGPTDPIYVDDGQELNIGVQLSVDQYNQLLNKKPAAINAIKYLEDDKAVRMSLIRPSRAALNTAAAEDLSV